MSILAVQSPRKTVLMFALLFIIMTAGVAAGIYLATRFGFVTWAKQATLKPVDLNNATGFLLNTPFPSCPVVAADGSEIDLLGVTAGRKSILAFVSNGCEACDEFLAAVRKGEIVPEDHQLILISLESEHFAASSEYPVYGIDQSVLDQHGIFTSPTIIGLNAHGEMKVICSGFTELLTRNFMEQSLQ